MQYSLIFAGAALAQLSIAHEHQHGKVHKRAQDVVTDIVYVTDYVYVTADNQYWRHSSSSTPSSSSASGVSSFSTSAYVAPASTSSTSTYVAPASTSSSSVATTLATYASSPSSSLAAYTTTTSSSTAASSSKVSSTSSAAASSTGISTSNLTPNGNKAGLSGYVGIQDTAAFTDLAPYISWYSDYTPNTPTSNGVQGIGMLWGADGSACGSVETDRLATFEAITTTPDIMFGFYEPDCSCPMSSEMTTSQAASDWDSLIAPLGEKGTVLGSPSMCKQKDEDFLTPFNAAISRTWDVTSIHINKPNLTEAMADVEYYVSTYGKPIWVSEFACVYDQPSWEPCTDQDTINTFINDVVAYFESNSDVVAYGPSNGEGLGDVWPLTDSNGDLTTSGQTYLSAIKGL